MVTGDVEMLPIAGLALVTFTLTEPPPATAWVWTTFPEESSMAVEMVTADGGADTVVSSALPKPKGHAITTPEGCRVTVPVFVSNPGAVTVYCTVPLDPNPCTKKSRLVL